MRNRAVIGWIAFGYDLLACLVAVAAGLVLGGRIHLRDLPASGVAYLDWSVLVIPLVVVGVFWSHGLHKKEAFVSRRVHLWLILRSFVMAGVMVAAVLWAAHAPATSTVYSSRRTTGVTLATLAALVLLGRLYLVGGAARAIMGRDHRTILVGGSLPALEPLRRRLEHLWGFNHLAVIPMSGCTADELTERVLGAVDEHYPPHGSVRNVFIDATAMPPHAVLRLSQMVKERGCEVYVASLLMRALATRRLLPELFQAPVVRVRRSLKAQVSGGVKRAFDVLGAAAVLVILSPLLATIAFAVRLSSPGPVLYRQERVGQSGRPFRMYKFRSMRVDSDHGAHREYVHRFIQGDLGAEGGRPDGGVHKMTGDPRTTPLGAILRKYSLDELPQLWNVLKGDMSLVGPRPPLPYEVEVYEDWHMLRLVPRPGVSGLWQVHGRSRVTFNEMVLQDVMYASNRSLFTDWVLCLRTIPAAVLGRGGA